MEGGKTKARVGHYAGASEQNGIRAEFTSEDSTDLVLMQAGLGPDLVRAASPITPFRDGSFQWAETGAIAHAIEVENISGCVFDVVAFYPDSSHRWWRLRNIASVLGEDALSRADWFGDPITLHATPTAWLKALAQGDRTACCIVDWSIDPRRLFRDFHLRCTTHRLAEKLRRRVEEVSAPTFRIEQPQFRARLRGAT